jgi:hypothetical protein
MIPKSSKKLSKRIHHNKIMVNMALTYKTKKKVRISNLRLTNPRCRQRRMIRVDEGHWKVVLFP